MVTDKAMPFHAKDLIFSVNDTIIQMYALYSTLSDILVSHIQIIADIEKIMATGKEPSDEFDVIDIHHRSNVPFPTMSYLLDAHTNWFS